MEIEKTQKFINLAAKLPKEKRIQLYYIIKGLEIAARNRNKEVS